jgi:hypothetical protein
MSTIPDPIPQDAVSNEAFFCDCFSDEHVVRLVYCPDDHPVYRDLYLSVFLAERGFWKRLWSGIKYILGYKCKYGHWDEFIVPRRELGRIIDILQRAKADMDRPGEGEATINVEAFLRP